MCAKVCVNIGALWLIKVHRTRVCRYAGTRHSSMQVRARLLDHREKTRARRGGGCEREEAVGGERLFKERSGWERCAPRQARLGEVGEV